MPCESCAEAIKIAPRDSIFFRFPEPNQVEIWRIEANGNHRLIEKRDYIPGSLEGVEWNAD